MKNIFLLLLVGFLSSCSNPNISKSLNKNFQYFVCQNLSLMEKKECIKKFNYQKSFKVQNKLHRDFFTEKYTNFIVDYMNEAMYAWTNNNFKETKKYLDNIDLVLHVNNLHKFQSLSQLVYTSRTSYPSKDTYESARWFSTHRYVRFIENTLRTKHRYLCKDDNCKDKAWKISQEAISNHFIENMIYGYINSLSNHAKIKKLLQKEELLQAQKSLLILSEKRGVFVGTKKWQNIFTKEIQDIKRTLFNYIDIQSLENKLTLKETQNILYSNEIVVSYIYSMHCRDPLLWEISKNRVIFKKTLQYGCTSGQLREKITAARIGIENTRSRKDMFANKDLIFLRKVLIDSLELPKKGSKLYFIVDETMSGIPFELLPMASGKFLGEIYQISYIPSVSILNTLKMQDNIIFKTFYIGLSKNKHKNSSLNDLRVNEISKKIADYYKNSLVLKESTETDIYTTLSNSNSKYVQFLTHSTYTTEGKQKLLYGADDKNDGKVTANEVLKKIKGATDTIFFTSCDSISSNKNYVGEAFSPLSQSIFSALKAKRMIATRWEIQDKVIDDFMGLYLTFREKNNLSSIKAFHKTINELKKLYPNKPKIWASFIYIGI